MTNLAELRFPVDDHLMRLEPVFFHSDGLYVKTQRGDHGTTFVTARGVEHRLRPLLPPGALEDRFVRRNANTVRGYLQAERDRARAGDHLDELRYFVEHLLPAFTARDCSATFPLDAIPWGPPPSTQGDPSGVI